MPVFLDTFGNASLAIFICDRCKMKRPMDEQMSDQLPWSEGVSAGLC